MANHVLVGLSIIQENINIKVPLGRMLEQFQLHELFSSM